MAGIIAKRAIVSVDYELTNYKNGMRFRNTPELEVFNGDVKNHFKNASAVRVGAEILITPRVSGRVGYSWVQSPYDKDVMKSAQVFTAGTVPHYTVDGDANYFTYGLGYKFTPSFYMDVAFIIKSQKDDLYAFSKYYHPENGKLLVDSQPSQLKHNVFSGQLTLGYKF